MGLVLKNDGHTIKQTRVGSCYAREEHDREDQIQGNSNRMHVTACNTYTKMCCDLTVLFTFLL
jgi:hypothetical protein